MGISYATNLHTGLAKFTNVYCEIETDTANDVLRETSYLNLVVHRSWTQFEG